MKERYLIGLVIGSWVSLLLPGQASAASFDCGLARLPDEKALCANSNLSALDSEMGGLWYAYSRVPMLMGSNGARTDEAQIFLKRRQACGANIACIFAVYSARIATLRAQINSSMTQFSELQNSK